MNFHAVKCCALSLFAAKEYFGVFMMHAAFVHTTSSKDFYTLLDFVCKTTACMKMAWCRSDKVSELYSMKIPLRIKKY